MEGGGSGSGSAPPSTLGLTKRKVPAEQRVHCDGFKLRGGCVPWRTVAGSTLGEIEFMLIEGINSPGKWSFPAGSLDPGEEVSVCAARETEEESGVRGVLGCFLGMFQSESKKPKKGGSRSYFFALRADTVINEGSDRWKDPDSTWESDGWRNRSWFTAADARPKLKKGQEAVLDALLSVPPEHLINATWRPVPAMALGNKALRLLLVGSVTHTSGIYQAESRKLVEATDTESGGAQLDLVVLPAGAANTECGASASQQFAVMAAALWEANAVVVMAVGEDEVVAHSHYACGLSAAAGKPVLCFVDSEEATTTLASDRRVTVQRPCASAREYGDMIRSFVATKFPSICTK